MTTAVAVSASPSSAKKAASRNLLATCWTTAGDANPYPGDQRSPVGIRERVEAASGAGFRGLGLLHADLMPALDEYGVRGLRTLLDDHGIVDLELELLTGWWATGPDRVRNDLLTAAEQLGARHIKAAPDVAGGSWNRDQWITAFAALAADAANAGTRVGLELLPWSNIRTVHEGLSLVRDAGAPAAGLIIDVWHTERAHTPPADLAAVPLRYIVGVELDDADAEPVGTLFDDTVNRRRLCGRGAFDLAGVIAALRATGWDGPWGAEILSEEHRKTPVREAVAAAFRTVEAVLKQRCQ
ncbi:sugar phosphate isomerase/epimerase [Couchioplanes caeruleus]|uniref:sugar phosphate isomerase/epimerase family protein n=1 Tax=Couchioplanes caeruleus TaxID=56438 RepID=UPI0020BD5761|nr:sugar phosphate isomerase/epimerase family protein [Couchioplanes caeruleus]UQU62660.1 sugar phosphate isomerase/epimerase [Couchioplanes caeruleus]